VDFGSLTVLAVIVVLALVVAISSIRIINEYERGVVFRLGRLIRHNRSGFDSRFDRRRGRGCFR